MPALRVGYAVAHPETIRRIQALLPTWPVTQLAIDVLAEAVQDLEFAEYRGVKTEWNASA
jgi:histidinol-phosphate/aromatic aminotransferase/cobyric acid decarboxylase-like protein